MKSTRLYLLLLLPLLTCTLTAQKEYKASLFGCLSDGSTLNTGSIQKAINYISETGGGTLNFYVGRYLTGTVYMKDNVTIRLHNGAILVGVASPYDYQRITNGPKALICADHVDNIAIVGKGVIQGEGLQLQQNILRQIEKGYLQETLQESSPDLISMQGCTNVRIDSIIMQNACGDALHLVNSKNVTINSLSIENSEVQSSQGIRFTGCHKISIKECYFDLAGEAIIDKGKSKGVVLKGNRNAEHLQQKAL